MRYKKEIVMKASLLNVSSLLALLADVGVSANPHMATL